MDKAISNSSIDKTARIYKGVRVVDSRVSAGCVIGDECDLVRVEMAECSEFGRRNLIRSTRIGFGSYTGTNTIIKNAEIGSYCSIAWNVSIGGGNHDMSAASTYTPYWWKRTLGLTLRDDRCSARCEIGSDVWIGSGANIVTGVKVGNGAVLGAGAVVVKDVPPYSIMGGVPARLIRYRFDEEICERLLRIAWWDWPREMVKQAAPLLNKKLDEQVIEDLEKIHQKMGIA